MNYWLLHKFLVNIKVFILNTYTFACHLILSFFRMVGVFLFVHILMHRIYLLYKLTSIKFTIILFAFLLKPEIYGVFFIDELFFVILFYFLSYFHRSLHILKPPCRQYTSRFHIMMLWWNRLSSSLTILIIHFTNSNKL